MAYTVKFKAGEPARFVRLLEVLVEGTFTFQATVSGESVVLKPVRLVAPKPYCGQHPGECLAGGPKKKGRWLEWDDWVAFHGVVNDALDAMHADADAWTNPAERLAQGKKMFVRKDNRRRVHFEWEEEWDDRLSQGVRVWNPGLDSSQYS